MKKILVPTDFSPYANAALQQALHIAKKTNASLTLLHTVEAISSSLIAPSGLSVDNTMIDSELVLHFTENANRKLTDLISPEDAKAVQIDYVVEIGKFYPAFLEIVKETEADLIVMGTKGATGFEEMVIGSNTEKVVRTAPCPVLAVKEQPENWEVNNIVFATNLAEDQLYATAKLKMFQKLFNAKIHLLRVNTPSNFVTTKEAETHFAHFAQKYQIQNYETHLYADVDEDDGIIHFANRIDADWIALATHQRKGLSHLLLGSIAEDVVNQAKHPVLTFNNQAF